MKSIQNSSQTTIWKVARLKRAMTQPRYGSRLAAAQDIVMGESTLAAIENGDRIPLPEEVWMMAEVYNAPELKCTFCHDYCRLGVDVPKAEDASLEHIAVNAYNVLRNTSQLRDSLMEIVADGKITDDEKPEMTRILKALDDVVQVAQDLKYAVQKSEIEERRYG